MPSADSRDEIVRQWVESAFAMTGRTKTDLARELGVDPSVLVKYERGKKLPSLYTLVDISRATGVGLPELIQELLEAPRDRPAPPPG